MKLNENGFFAERPPVGTMAEYWGMGKNRLERGSTVRVRSYHQCNDVCMVVTKAHARIEYVVSWRVCKPISKKENQ